MELQLCCGVIMEDNKFLNLARILMAGHDLSSFEQKEVEQLVNTVLHLIRSGFFGRGKPALICRDFIPQRIAKVICTEYDAGKVIYEEDELIRYVDPDNANTFPDRGLEGMRLRGAAIEMNTRVLNLNIANDIQYLLMEIWKSEHGYNFLPKSLLPIFGEGQMELFYRSTLSKLSRVYFYLSGHGDNEFTGTYLINLSPSLSSVGFAILEYQLKVGEKCEVELREDVYGMDVEIETGSLPCHNDVKGEVVRKLSTEEQRYVLGGLNEFIRKNIFAIKSPEYFKYVRR